MHLIQGFVINLDNRKDRWIEASSQFSQFPFSIQRISAVNAVDIQREEPYVPGGVAATWRSHQKAMQAHIDSQASYALILEDDFLVRKDINRILNKIVDLECFDLVQLGYLSPSLLRRFIRYLVGMRDVFLKLLYRLHGIMSFGALEKLVISEQKDVPLSIVLNDIQAGGQSYLVSRRFSEAAQEMNNPSFLSADGMLIALSETRTFKVGRTRTNFIKQSNSVSSVQQRFKQSDK